MDISSLTQNVNSASGLANLILVTPQTNIGYQPQNKPTKDGSTSALPAAILFNYEGEQSVMLESDITDHFVEDNTTIQDQIALKPETISTHGFIGELNDVVPKALQSLKTAADKLTVVSAYVPVLSATAILAYNNAAFLYASGSQVTKAAVAGWNSITGGQSTVNQTKQQIAFNQFYGYWQNRTLFTVQTPWAVFNDMAIKSLRAVQDAETRVITDFEVTFKKMRFAQTITLSTTIDSTNFQGRSAAQSAGLTDLGTSTPAESLSLSSALAGVA